MRQFLRIQKSKLEIALKYNLDSRRLRMEKLVFTRTINCDYIGSNEVVLVVHTLLQSGAVNCEPTRSTDYYIEYVIFF